MDAYLAHWHVATSEAARDAAILASHALDFAADEHWPLGYRPDEVRARALLIVATLAAYVDTLPEGQRQTAARELVARLRDRRSAAKVTPRRQRVVA